MPASAQSAAEPVGVEISTPEQHFWALFSLFLESVIPVASPPARGPQMLSTAPVCFYNIGWSSLAACATCLPILLAGAPSKEAVVGSLFAEACKTSPVGLPSTSARCSTPNFTSPSPVVTRNGRGVGDASREPDVSPVTSFMLDAVVEALLKVPCGALRYLAM